MATVIVDEFVNKISVQMDKASVRDAQKELRKATDMVKDLQAQQNKASKGLKDHALITEHASKSIKTVTVATGKLGKTSVAVTKQVKGLGLTTDDLADGMEGLGFELDAGSKKLVQVLGKMGKLSASGTVLAGVLAAVALAAVAAAVAVVKVGVDSGLATAELTRTAQAAGTNVNAYRELAASAALLTGSSDAMISSLGAINDQLLEAQTRGSDADIAFKRLGISVATADGHIRDSADVMRDLAQHYATTTDKMRAYRDVQSILGSDTRALIPLLRGGADGLDEMAQRARVFGGEIDEVEQTVGKDLQESLEALSMVGEQAWREALAPIAEGASTITVAMADWYEQNEELISSVGDLYRSLTSDQWGAGLNIIGSLLKLFTSLSTTVTGTSGNLNIFGRTFKAVFAGLTGIVDHFMWPLYELEDLLLWVTDSGDSTWGRDFGSFADLTSKAGSILGLPQSPSGGGTPSTSPSGKQHALGVSTGMALRQWMTSPSPSTSAGVGAPQASSSTTIVNINGATVSATVNDPRKLREIAMDALGQATADQLDTLQGMV